MRLAARCAVLLTLALGALSLLAVGPSTSVGQPEPLAAIHAVASVTAADAVPAGRGSPQASHVPCAGTGAEAVPEPLEPAVWWLPVGVPAGDATGTAGGPAAPRAPPRYTAS
jgi:hypothetical protein